MLEWGIGSVSGTVRGLNERDVMESSFLFQNALKKWQKTPGGRSLHLFTASPLQTSLAQEAIMVKYSYPKMKNILCRGLT